MAERKEDKWKEYFVAIIPPSPHLEEALKLKQYFRDRYNSKGALRSPPHITLHMPFRWKEAREEELIDKLRKFSADVRIPPVVIRFCDFGSFSPRVIFIVVEKTAGLHFLQYRLERFCKEELNLFNSNYQDRPYHPHLTVAFRDLKKPAFHEAWEEFRERKFEGEFIANKFTLLKHDGDKWEAFREFEWPSG
jgi:2'-5' RNA ligase